MTDANVVATPAPTVALVHGAFADSSGWTGVIHLLRAAGVGAVAVSNPLRGIAEDTAYVASALAQIPGPVLAVGHSYGGAIISNAATQAPNVVGLVYVSGVRSGRGREADRGRERFHRQHPGHRAGRASVPGRRGGHRRRSSRSTRRSSTTSSPRT